MFQTYRLPLVAVLLPVWIAPVCAEEESLRRFPLSSRITEVQPMTGIVLWTTNAAARTAPIQLEYSYLAYDQIVKQLGKYDWSAVETLLDDVASRKHQSIIRWHDTYVGRPTGMPAYLKALPDYQETTAPSEGQPTGFPDWSHPEAQAFLLNFFREFSRKYDGDPRLAYVQVGFGLWAEYHIYDGPMELGKTFPSRELQAQFARHLAGELKRTPWMISVDAAGDHTPFAGNPELLQLPFGVFDDSFNHARHRQENEPNWVTFGLERWKTSPCGGEFSFFETKDQRLALAPNGPHGIPFAKQAAKFHVSFIVGDDQSRFQKPERIREAGLACGYQLHVTACETSKAKTRVTVENRGIAPPYFDAYFTVKGVRSPASLRGLLPGETRVCEIAAGLSPDESLTIESDQLVPGQQVQFEAELPADPATSKTP